jgi:uncharacterized membrane protein YhfC
MVSTSAQVSALSIAFMFVTLIACFGLPVFLAVRAKKKYGSAFSFVPLLVGALAFFIAQIIIRLPIIQGLLPTFGWYQQFMQMQWPYLIFLSFTAALVEEPARYIAFKIMKTRRAYPDGLAYGIGHGGIEAILIVGLSYISNIALSFMINGGSLGPLAGVLPASAISALTDTPSYMFLIGGIERVFAIALQIALSLLVLRGFQTGRRMRCLLLAIGIHGSVNLLAQACVLLGQSALPGDPQLGSVLLSEGFLLIVALLSVLYIVKRAKEWKKGISGETADTASL